MLVALLTALSIVMLGGIFSPYMHGINFYSQSITNQFDLFI